MSYFLVLSHFFLLHLFILFKLNRVSWLISYCLILFLIAWVCFYILMLFHFLAFFFLLHLFIELILFNYSSQTLLGLFLMFPDSLFPDVSHCCHGMWPYLSDMSRFCHWVWPYIKEKVCEQLINICQLLVSETSHERILS